MKAAGSKGRPIAGLDFKLLGVHLAAEGQVQVRGQAPVDRVGKIDVEQALRLDLGAQIERRGRIGTHGRVERAAHDVLDFAFAERNAEIVADAVVPLAAQTRDDAAVDHLAAEAGREAARENLIEDEAIGTLDHGLQVGGRVDVGASPGPVCRRVGDQQVVVAVDEHAAAIGGIAVKEAAVGDAARVVTEGVDLAVFTGFHGGVYEKFVVVLDDRCAPDDGEVLGVVGYRPVAGIDQGLGAGILNTAAGGFRILHLEGQSGKAVAAQMRAEQAGHLPDVPVSLVILAEVRLNVARFRVVRQDEIHHPGNGIGAVLRRCAVAQDLHLLHGDAGKRHQIDTLRALVDTGDEFTDYRAPVAALAVDQHQGAVRGHAAQVGRPYQGAGIADGFAADVVGRHHVGQHVQYVRAALAFQIGFTEHIDGHRRFCRGARGAARADNDQLFDLFRRSALRYRGIGREKRQPRKQGDESS